MPHGTISFVTNRNPLYYRRKVVGFGEELHPGGVSELRCGRVTITCDERELADAGAVLAAAQSGTHDVAVWDENFTAPTTIKLGSTALFEKLRMLMMHEERDTIVYVHGYAVSFKDACATALALQWYFRVVSKVEANVVVFSWPSDGALTPWRAYKSDRQDAEASGPAFGRAFLKLRDYLRQVREHPELSCSRRVHLLAHSMGNYVVENALRAIVEHHGGSLPMVFDQILMAAPDVDADAFEHAHKLARLYELSRRVTVYRDANDHALMTSDVTKGHPSRLGLDGPVRRDRVPDRVEVVDVSLLPYTYNANFRHSYHTEMNVLHDMAQVLTGAQGDTFTGAPQRNWDHRRWQWVLT